MTYKINFEDDSFAPVEYEIEKMTNRDIKKNLSKGLNDEQVLEQREIYGRCLIDFPLPNALVFFATEFTRPLNIFQYLAFIIWIYN